MLSSNGQALVYLGNMIINFKRKRDESPVHRRSEPNGPGAACRGQFACIQRYGSCIFAESLPARGEPGRKKSMIPK